MTDANEANKFRKLLEKWVDLAERTLNDHPYTFDANRHMDFYQGEGNDVEAIDQNKHNSSGGRSKDGGSNFAFADGSVRLLKYGASLSPENLWAVTDQWRDAPSPLEENAQ